MACCEHATTPSPWLQDHYMALSMFACSESVLPALATAASDVDHLVLLVTVLIRNELAISCR